jgi:stage V sporulation protein B
MVTLLIAYAPEVLRFFYGNAYLEAAETMQIYSVGVGFLTIFYVLAFALNGAGKNRIPMTLTFFGVAFVVLLNLFFIPRFGITGAAMATTIASAVLMLAILIYTKLYFKAHIPLRLLLLSSLSAFGIWLAAQYLPGDHLLFILWGAILTSLYFAALKLLGIITTEDITPLLRKFATKK